jgi:hypothetical protein
MVFVIIKLWVERGGNESKQSQTWDFQERAYTCHNESAFNRAHQVTDPLSPQKKPIIAVVITKKPNYSTLLTLMSFFFSATFFCNIPVLYQQIENRLCIQQVEPLQH